MHTSSRIRQGKQLHSLAINQQGKLSRAKIINQTSVETKLDGHASNTSKSIQMLKGLPKSNNICNHSNKTSHPNGCMISINEIHPGSQQKSDRINRTGGLVTMIAN